ncbi:MAG: FKBP-type peptidyl-prolyl cis-trans isomerase [Acidimicrobiales bacterium]
MATSKRERQKAARREKLERLQRSEKRRKNIRRSIIVGVIAILVIATGAYVFSGNSTTKKASATTTTTSAPNASTTSTVPTSFAPVSDPSPAGTFGKAPTVIVPPGNPPTSMELSNLIKGTGAVANTGDSLKVEYVLATYSTRKVVQSSWTSQPFTFTLGPNSVIAGWAEGVVGMRVGGRRELIIPPSLGYHNTSPGPGIAKNDTLVFVIDLLKVTK